jgi:hypothetical protein
LGIRQSRGRAAIKRRRPTVAEHIITVNVPTVPFGPEGIPMHERDAKYYREAARNIRFHASRGRAFSGSNVTETVARLCVAVADALEATTTPPAEDFSKVPHPYLTYTPKETT